MVQNSTPRRQRGSVATCRLKAATTLPDTYVTCQHTACPPGPTTPSPVLGLRWPGKNIAHLAGDRRRCARLARGVRLGHHCLYLQAQSGQSVVNPQEHPAAFVTGHIFEAKVPVEVSGVFVDRVDGNEPPGDVPARRGRLLDSGYKKITA